jgi:uncharacterized protein YeaO (DUF488 family)
MRLKIKRAYTEADPGDGTRILIDRLWPRGVTKEKARIDIWMRDIAPSSELRKWFGHDPEKWTEFQKRYLDELNNNQEMVDYILDMAKDGPVTLVYSAKDEQHNDAVVLLGLLDREMSGR